MEKIFFFLHPLIVYIEEKLRVKAKQIEKVVSRIHEQLFLWRESE